jgi:hypothetical protein
LGAKVAAEEAVALGHVALVFVVCRERFVATIPASRPVLKKMMKRAVARRTTCPAESVLVTLVIVLRI